MKYGKLFFLLIIASMMLTACSDKTSKTSAAVQNTITASKQATSTDFYYNATIQPISVENVVSPADGIVKKIDFTYGGFVKNGATLVVIDASKLQENFLSAVTTFLTAKDKLTTSQTSYQGNKALYDNKIISQDEFNSALDSLENDELSMMEAVYKLKKTLDTIPGFNTNVESLSLKDMGQVKALLAKNYSQINLTAKMDGVALMPPQSSGSDSSSSESKAIHQSSSIKQGQVLLAVGNLNGLSLKVAVTEININQIKKGQVVTVTSPALPGITLQGTVSMVGSQAQSASGGQSELATFPVSIQVDKLTSAQQQVIRVGMTAQVKISIPGPEEIVIPIDAVSESNGQTTVTIINAKTGKPSTVSVETGPTTPTGVIITSGISVGDKVVVND